MDIAALDEAAHDGLARAAATAPQIMKWKVKYRGTPYPTRWNNLRPGDYGDDYFDRAAGALEGLFVHDRAEAEYFSTYEDGNAHLLDGATNYVLHFNKEQIAPTLTNGFWSFTMYGADFQLVKNPIDRFSIGDRTKGLTYNADGSLDIYIQHAAPAGPRGQLAAISAERTVPYQLPHLPAGEGCPGSGDARQIPAADQGGQLRTLPASVALTARFGDKQH